MNDRYFDVPSSRARILPVTGRPQLISICRLLALVVVVLIGASRSEAATLTLAWDPASDADTAGYILWYGKAPGTYTARVDAGFLLQYRVDGLDAETTYCFAVQAYDRMGSTSEFSTEVCGRTAGKLTSPGDDPAPPPPAEEPVPDEEPDEDPVVENPPAGEAPPNGGATGDIVLYASKATVTKGNWGSVGSTGAAGGRAMRSTDRRWSAPNAPLAAPAHYFETTFTASANTPYRIWLRLRGSGDSKWNDAVWVQFSDSLVNGRSGYRIGTKNALLVNLEPCDRCGTAGWGWQNTAYWLKQATTVTFARSGAHTIRVQIREDGVEIDQILLSPSMRYRPGPTGADTTILPETQAASAPDSGSGSGGASGPGSASEIVLHASDAGIIRGNWKRLSSAGAVGGTAMRSSDSGWAATDRPFASPTNHFDLTFNAAAGTTYRVWVRLRAHHNFKWNDSVWMQFSDALVNGKPAYRTGTTDALLVNLESCDWCGVSGWGWQNTAYWLPQVTTITFATSGTHTIRVQTREDGVEIDQVVLSPSKYRSSAPGSRTNDATRLVKSPRHHRRRRPRDSSGG